MTCRTRGCDGHECNFTRKFGRVGASKRQFTVCDAIVGCGLIRNPDGVAWDSALCKEVIGDSRDAVTPLNSSVAQSANSKSQDSEDASSPLREVDGSDAQDAVNAIHAISFARDANGLLRDVKTLSKADVVDIWKYEIRHGRLKTTPARIHCVPEHEPLP